MAAVIDDNCPLAPCETAIAAVCFGERIGAFDTGEVGTHNDDARQLSAAISETFVCFRATMFNFPWYRYFRTPTYQRFERAANTMRQSVTSIRHTCQFSFSVIPTVADMI